MDTRFVTPLLTFAGAFAASFVLCLSYFSADAGTAVLALCAAFACGVFFVQSLDYKLLS